MTNVFNPIRPAGAYHELLARVLPQAREHRGWAPADGPLPALFVSHGAPPTLDDDGWLQDLFDWGQSMPKPRGIVMVSAHWENAPLAISSPAAGTPLYYDFAGFHPHYYTLQYRTPDATALALRVAGTLRDTTPLHQHRSRGLDHGAFIPLMAMYPAADVPVIQLSMPSLDPEALLHLGQRLKSMREEGYLVVGSGFMTHSFAAMRQQSMLAHIREFDAWANDAARGGDVDALIDFRRKAPAAEIAHPTADHFVPLLLSIGAGSEPGTGVTSPIDAIRHGNSTRSLQMA